MYKISVPVSFDSVTPENSSFYIDVLKKCKAERVFFCGTGEIHTKDCRLYQSFDALKEVVRTFKAEGFEVGVWTNAFGHGVALLTENVSDEEHQFLQITGIRGESGRYANCPLDENFRSAYFKGITKIAELDPDLIMLDDDFRLNLRAGYYFGCFCPLHLKKYYEIIGEEIPKEKLEKLILTGGRNKYRDAYFKLMSDTLLDFAKETRKTLDKVNPNIRLGTSVTCEAWDMSGTTPIEIAKAFAGGTKPFTRVAGAPYWNGGDIILAIDFERAQQKWCENSGVEFFSEGDTYPRPRYNVPSKMLELFEYALIANGGFDGVLAYIFPYLEKPSYEMGYAERYVKNGEMRDKITGMFKDKRPTGVQVLNVCGKIKDWDMPESLEDKIADKLIDSCYSPGWALLSANSVTTTFEKSEYPMLIVGENAKYIEKDSLRNGAILDISAAKILHKEGIDTGLLSDEPFEPFGEYFINEDNEIRNIGAVGHRRISCSEKAEILSFYLPDKTPATYYYENSDGQKFFVLAFDMLDSGIGYYDRNKNYMNNYHRQQQIIRMIKRLCGKKLPAMCEKNPNLYILASKGENGEMSVLMLNIFADDVISPIITLDRSYNEIEFLNCEGRIDGDKVYLSDIAPYGVAAFTVR